MSQATSATSRFTVERGMRGLIAGAIALLLCLAGGAVAVPGVASAASGGHAPSGSHRTPSGVRAASVTHRAHAVPPVQEWTPVSHAVAQPNGTTKLSVFGSPTYRRGAQGWTTLTA